MRHWQQFTAGYVTGTMAMFDRCQEFTKLHRPEWDRRYRQTARLVWPDDPPAWPNDDIGLRADLLRRELLPGP